MYKITLGKADIEDLADLADYANNHNDVTKIASFVDSVSDKAIEALGMILGIDYIQAMWDSKPKAVVEDEDFKNYINNSQQFSIFDFHKAHKAVNDKTDTYYPKAMTLSEIRDRINKTLNLVKKHHVLKIEDGRFISYAK